MAARKKRPSAEADALLEELLVDAYGDDEQLTALAQGIGDALDLPLDVHVVGEPVSLLAVDYEGNERRGIVARCRGEDGTEYGVSLADVELPQEAPGHSPTAGAPSLCAPAPFTSWFPARSRRSTRTSTGATMGTPTCPGRSLRRGSTPLRSVSCRWR